MDVFDCRMGCVCEVGVSGDVSLVAEAASIANGHVCVFRHTHHAIIEEVREDVETLGGEEVYSTGQLIFGSWSWWVWKRNAVKQPLGKKGINQSL